MAEGTRFELVKRFLVCYLSKVVDSTTLPTLHLVKYSITCIKFDGLYITRLNWNCYNLAGNLCMY